MLSSSLSISDLWSASSKLCFSSNQLTQLDWKIVSSCLLTVENPERGLFCVISYWHNLTQKLFLTLRTEFDKVEANCHHFSQPLSEIKCCNTVGFQETERTDVSVRVQFTRSVRFLSMNTVFSPGPRMALKREHNSQLAMRQTFKIFFLF
jgi:hypothetical protein